MSIDKNDDENFPGEAEAYYEELASQEEVYLEETEEELRMTLISDDPHPSKRGVGRSIPSANNDPCVTGSLDEQLNHAAEDLITGDSDDPPLSEEAVVEMLDITLNARKFGRSGGA